MISTFIQRLQKAIIIIIYHHYYSELTQTRTATWTIMLFIYCSKTSQRIFNLNNIRKNINS